MDKAFVLLSGGVDSTTCLYMAQEDVGNVEGISVFYGQRHRKEIEYAKRSCDYLGVSHHVLDLSSIVPKTMLTDKDAAIPEVSYSEIKGVSPTYVPFRNGLLLAAVTSHIAGEWDKVHGRSGDEAEDFSEWGVYFGAHAEDAHNWAYPDCTPEFIGAMANAIHVGTYRAIRLCTPLEWLAKWQIVQLGDELGVRWLDTWSCYAGGEQHCGVCPTCRARIQAFEGAVVEDPTQYARQAAA